MNQRAQESSRIADLCVSAGRKAQAARILVAEVPASEEDALLLARAGWQLFGEAASLHTGTATDAAPSSADALDRFAPRGDQLRQLLEGEGSSDAALIATASLMVETFSADLLRETVGTAQYRRPLQIGGVVLLAVLTVWASYWAYVSFGPAVWLARLYPNLEFGGKPLRTGYRNMEQEWGRGQPHPEIPEKGFSGQFDTCLRLTEATTVHFWLQSKEGSRLLVNGRRVVSNWASHKDPVAKQGHIKLLPGNHHVSIEYFNQTGQATLRARVGLGGASYRPMDHRIVTAPTAWPDDPARQKDERGNPLSVCPN